jgi:HEAT repeat protein
MLGERDPKVRGAGAEALGKSKDERAIGALAGLRAKDPKPAVRVSAIKALAAIAAGLLSEAKGHYGKVLRISVEDRALKIADSLLIALEDTDESVRKKAENALLSADVPWSSSFIVSVGFAERLSNTLVRALKSQSSRARRVAAVILGNAGDESAVPALAGALKEDSDANVRKAAAEALGRLGEASALPALREARNKDRNKGVRKAAAKAIKEILSPRWQEAPLLGGLPLPD